MLPAAKMRSLVDILLARPDCRMKSIASLGAAPSTELQTGRQIDFQDQQFQAREDGNRSTQQRRFLLEGNLTRVAWAGQVRLSARF